MCRSAISPRHFSISRQLECLIPPRFVAMTILPKKAEEESDSDGDNSAGSPHESSPHGAAGHAPLGSPNTPEEGGYHSPDGFYHRYSGQYLFEANKDKMPCPTVL